MEVVSNSPAISEQTESPTEIETSEPMSISTTTVTMPSNSFLLSSLLNLKNNGSSNSNEGSSSCSGSNPGPLNKSLKSKSLNSSSGDDGEEDSDSGVKITYEQISSKPPRKRLCYCFPGKVGNGSSANANGAKVNANTNGSTNSTAKGTNTSDEENMDHSQNGHDPSQVSSDSDPNPSPISSTSSSPSSSSSAVLPTTPKEVQFPIAIRTDEYRRRSNRVGPPGSGCSHNITGRPERYLIASRDIEQGEIILKESPLIAGPISRRSKTLDKSKYCLGCYQHVNGLYKCSKCGWPVCNSKCEKMPDHAEFECEVFASNPVSPIVHSSEYEKIKVLRCLLLRDKYPERWNKILELDPHDDLRQGNFIAVSSTINLWKFIKQECHFKQFDGETVKHIVGVSAVNAFPTDGLLSPASIKPYHRNRAGPLSNYYVPTNASLLFSNASLLTQDCVPNSYPVISKTPHNNSFLLTVIASQRIKKGQIITHSFIDATRGTFQRRSELKENYYFSCDCKRCTDSSELSTHYSSLKCPKSNCPNGYMYPANSTSLDLTGHWCCNYSPRCDFRITNGQVNELLKHVQYDISKTFVQHSLFQEYENLESVLEKYKGKVLHPNHFLIMDIQYAIISCINKLLVLVNEEEAIKLASKQIEYCRECLEIADILHPGSNRLRGNLLFYLHEGMLIIFLGEFKRNIHQESFVRIGRNKFEEIIITMNESKTILVNEPEGSTEYQKIKTLSADSANLQPLLSYFDVKL